MKGNIRKNNTTNPLLNFLELLKLKKFIFFCFGISTFGHMTVLFRIFEKLFILF